MKRSSDREQTLAGLLVALGLVACAKPAPPDASPSADGGAEAAAASHASATCDRCHLPEFRATQRPPHEGARPATCGVCHTQERWHRARIEHLAWPLTGAHARAAADESLAGKEHRVKCFWCHRGDPPVFEGTKKECVACHEDEAEDVHFPGHDTFSRACETCHDTETWKHAKRPPRSAPAIVDAGAPHDAGAPAPRPTAVKPTPTPTTAPTPAPTTKPTATTKPRPVPTPAPDVTSHASRRR